MQCKSKQHRHHVLGVLKLKKQSHNTFYCFSPLVMLTTFTIESILAAYVFLTTRLKTQTQRLVTAILILLAVFQLVEYAICQVNDQQTINALARVGFMAITFLPPLGIHLSSAIVKKKRAWYIDLGYVLALIWSVYFVFFQKSVLTGVCGANYAIFDLHDRWNSLWGMYYMALLFIGLWEAVSFARRKKYKKHAEALWYLALGYLSFMIPAWVINVVYPSTQNGIPSIMCGFALILACILTFFVLPNAETKK